jgi:hypothetical protein
VVDIGAFFGLITTARPTTLDQAQKTSRTRNELNRSAGPLYDGVTLEPSELSNKIGTPTWVALAVRRRRARLVGAAATLGFSQDSRNLVLLLMLPLLVVLWLRLDLQLRLRLITRLLLFCGRASRDGCGGSIVITAPLFDTPTTGAFVVPGNIVAASIYRIS